MVIDEMMESVFEGIGLQLLLKINHNHGILIVIILFEVWHNSPPVRRLNYIKIKGVWGVLLLPERLNVGRAVSASHTINLL